MTSRSSTARTFAVEGLHCDGCARVVETALLGVDGVTAVTVRLAEQEVVVVGSAEVALLMAAVAAAGKKLRPPIALVVGGMACGHCSGEVEKALAAVPGVDSAAVDLEAGRATVTGTASAEALVAAVEATGKTAEVVTPTNWLGSDAARPAAAATTTITPAAPAGVEVAAVGACEFAAAAATRPSAGAPGATARRAPPDVGAPSRPPIALVVGGMACAHCSGEVEKALAAVPGVDSAAVDLEAGRATVTGTASAEALVAAVEATGYSAHLDSAHAAYAVDGMVCPACVATVKRAIAAVDGVQFAVVHLG